MTNPRDVKTSTPTGQQPETLSTLSAAAQSGQGALPPAMGASAREQAPSPPTQPTGTRAAPPGRGKAD